MERRDIPFGYIADEKVYLSAYMEFSDRQIGEVKESEEKTIQYFLDRFQHLVQKIDELEKAINESENKGSYLMKLLHMKESLGNYDGLGDYHPLFERLTVLEEDLNVAIAKNRERNSEIKTALLEELDQALAESDWREATDKVLDVKDRWIKTGNAKKEINAELDLSFQTKLTDFFDRKQVYFEDRRKAFDVRIQKCEDYINELKSLKPKKAEPGTIDRVREIQREWRNVGELPAREKRRLDKDLRYHTNYFFRRPDAPSGSFQSRGGFQGRSGPPARTMYGGGGRPQDGARPAYSARPNVMPSPEELESNLVRKVALIQEAETLADLGTRESVDELRKLQQIWKGIGMVPKERAKEVTEHFLILCDRGQERIFLENLAANKDPEYTKKNNREKTRFKMKLIRDLLVRDEQDLQTYQENLDRLNATKQAFDKMLHNKYLNQKRKVIVKRQLLQELKVSLDQI
ncbi:MAG: DUF349 domain-containing protein [Imperialibacter sp.]|uniref:DUF349 domain-containing protein n=1 Tax=Imperialibacter sp. TaxID=2038411 RepID=UPI0030DC94DB